MRDQRLKKYFNLDNTELKEERIVKKKVFKDKDANISSNALNSSSSVSGNKSLDFK